MPLCFHEGTGSYYSTIEPRFGENRFMRHVASHSTEMQLALIALDARRHFRILPPPQGRVSRSAELVGAGTARAGSNGICANTTIPTRPI